MSKGLLVLGISLLALVIGATLVSLPIGTLQIKYYTSGTFTLTNTEWDVFKVEVAKEEIPLRLISYLDSGDSKLVQIQGYEVSKDFSFGEIKEEVSKIGAVSIIETILILAGLLGSVFGITMIVESQEN